jgi:hypothetical protein
MLSNLEVSLAALFGGIVIAVFIVIGSRLEGCEYARRDDFFFDAIFYAPLVLLVALVGPLFLQPANIISLLGLAVVSILHAGDMGDSHMSAGLLFLWTLLLLAPVSAVVAWRVWRRYKQFIASLDDPDKTDGSAEEEWIRGDPDNPYSSPGVPP